MLRQLWEHGPSTIRELTEQLYPGGGTTHYATVQKLLDRLERKTCVSRELSGRVNVFEASVARDELIALRLKETADKLCGGSLAPLLTQLVGDARLKRDEVAELRRLVGRLAGKRGRS